jgi:phospholipase D-like protein
VDGSSTIGIVGAKETRMRHCLRLFRTLLPAAALATSAVALLPARAAALDDLCDPAVTDCRAPLLAYIRAEQVEIDVGMWFMEDARFSAELVRRRQAGVKVRIIFDNRSDEVGHPANQDIVDQLASGGIQMRLRVTPRSIEHWKVMIFHGQNIVYFGSANFSADAFVPETPYVNYVDETIYFTDNTSVVNSFRTKFDDSWLDSTNYVDYANVVHPLTRSYGVFDIDPELNFTPGEDFVARTMRDIDAERTKIDVMMYRIVDDRALTSMIRAQQRGTPIRLIVDPQQYRDITRQGVAFYLDSLYMAGIPMKFTVHQGLNHGKLTLLYGQGLSIFGSSNWTVPSANVQHEENYFTRNTAVFNWFVDFFERRWNNTSPVGVDETGPFTPLPPDKPSYQSPGSGATGVATSGTRLRWIGGPWGQYYDIYFGTSSNPPLFAPNQFLGPSIYKGNQIQSFTLPELKPGTTYYWKIVSKTAALQTRAGNTWSFTTAGSATPLPSGANTVVLWASNVPGSDVHGDWTRSGDSSAAGGAALLNPDRGRAKIAPALASPANYFESHLSAVSGVGYRLWIRMRAQGDSTGNDSVHVQFNDSQTSSGAAWARIGTSSSLEPVLQAGPDGGSPHSWGWTDNGWTTPGAPVYFASSGSHTIRIQQREDGAVVDQIVLSPDRYFLAAPGWREDDTTILASGDGTSSPPATPPSSEGTVVLWPGTTPASQIHGAWQTGSDSGAGGVSIWNPNLGAAKIDPALASPANYFEWTFPADAGRAYHVWIRMRAQSNSVNNDSVYMQFNDAVTNTNQPYARIGTPNAAEFVLQDGSHGTFVRSWGWTDNGWDDLGPHVYFTTSGTHRLRVQQREDGAIIDQIVISPTAYLTAPPGGRYEDATVLQATTGSAPPPPPPPSGETIVLWPTTGAARITGSAWRIGTDSGAGGTSIWNPNAGASKIAPALASPSSYFEMTFTADANTAYHVWIRMRAQSNSFSNDSVHMQFSDAIDGSGAAYARIGTSGSAEFVLQNGSAGPPLHSWGWTDNGWGSLGRHVRFANGGTHTLRVQQREDGAIIDQIVISPDTYLTSAPGARKEDTTVLDRTGG